jgi:predicted nucleotidyltransferase
LKPNNANKESLIPLEELDQILNFLRANKSLLRDRFGVVRLGVFGSFVNELQKASSDIDLIVEFEKGRKNIHDFLGLRRFLEHELSRTVDMGLEQSFNLQALHVLHGNPLFRPRMTHDP